MEARPLTLLLTLLLHGAPCSSQVVVTRDGCGTTRLCVETPDDCYPAASSSCLFSSFLPLDSDKVLNVKLSGESTGYVGLGLTADITKGSTMLFLCYQNSSGAFFFRTMLKNNTDSSLAAADLGATQASGTVQGNSIKCDFRFPTTTLDRGLGIKHIRHLRPGMTRGHKSMVIKLGTGNVTGDTITPFLPTLVTSSMNLQSPTGATSGAAHAAPPAAAPLLLSLLTLRWF